MKILLLEPFFTGSHKAWAEGYQKHSQHQVDILSLSGHHWKWRMHGGAVTLARMFLEAGHKPDLILASDMLDLTTFLALTNNSGTASAIYFHENQLTYPWSPNDVDIDLKRDNHYAFINYTSAMMADAVFFNSTYHRESFLNEVPQFLKQFPDYNELESVEIIKRKSQVLHLGMDLKKFDQYSEVEKSSKPLIIWNHRWEYDKNPEEFFKALLILADEGLDFEVSVLGESYPKKPSIFSEAKAQLGNRIVQFGFAESFEEYAQWLWKGDILPVTSNQDYFGGSVVEAIYCNCHPLLPNRLAYPEHIPKSQYGEMLYISFDDLVNKLRFLLKDISATRKMRTTSFVEKYNWSVMAKVYDEALSRIKIK